LLHEIHRQLGRLDPHPLQLVALHPPHDDPADDEKEPAPVEKLTTERQRATSALWQRGHATSGSREKTSSSKSWLQAVQWYS
jgi:hypothetical protein